MRRIAGPNAHLIGLVALFASVVGQSCQSDERSDRWMDLVAEWRLTKDARFRSDPIPVPRHRKIEFLPLLYYPPDRSYAAPAELTHAKASTTQEMIYSDGTVRMVRRLGTLEFMLHAEHLSLASFVEVGAKDTDSMFVPFKDLTNGSETYSAGRLLDIARTRSGIYEIDFNFAYNPYCYYDETYSCPLTPKENRLPIQIPAGERIRSR